MGSDRDRGKACNNFIVSLLSATPYVQFSLAALKSYLEFCLLEPLPSHFGKKNNNNHVCVSVTQAQLTVVVYGINAACEQRASQLHPRFAAVQVEDVSLAQQTVGFFHGPQIVIPCLVSALLR